MFDSLSDRLHSTLSGLSSKGRLTEEDVTRAMREIRLALLEADVNFKVVKQFTSTVKERALGIEVQRQLNPGQQVVKIVNEELTALMGGSSAGLTFAPRPPTVVLMAGLQGSGKTTATAKLAAYLQKEHGSSVALAACDVYRPAAVEQLIKVGGQAGATVYEQGTDRDPVDIAVWALDQAKRDGKDALIIDTSGRLHIDEALMGGAGRDIAFAPRPPTVIVMAGLQGSGKTTAAAKLARYLREEHGSSVALAACDVYRPAAVDQLVKLGAQVGADVYEQGTDADPVSIARWARDRAAQEGKDVLVVDTSGRLHVDQALMEELAEIRKAIKPHTILLVVDAMTGQDAVNVAEQFAEAVEFDGVLMSKLDGDARGGAALSVKAVTGKPILFASVGEKLDQLERFHPERMAQRILGMGDVMSLIEKAEKQFEEDEARELERKLRRNEFTLEDFLKQLKTLRKMGPLQSILGMLPGLSGQQLSQMKVDEREIDRVEAIVLSMTPEERRRPELIKGSRRLRIAKGSGTSVQQVNQLVKQFGQMRKVMKQIGRGKMPDLGALMRQAR